MPNASELASRAAELVNGTKRLRNYHENRRDMKADEIARQAANLVSGDRERVHGDKQSNFANIARLWDAWLSIRRGSELTGADVAKMMGLLKVARMESGEINEDDATDACGYLAIAGELAATGGGDGR